ncbi:3318_t:CDS:2 [Racocetra fulgida]|uniref:3318_t:CDS:1 n=1 Tax=Racocetra fulgida TaxID=60492 RepID=A0A9N8WGI7_9GLOM|nr:3318_t:CDS:2 [Racocetra fulgida]
MTFFRLKSDAYDSVMASQIAMSVLCKYDPKGRHANVAEATKLCNVIEWSYPSQGSLKSGSDASTSKNRRFRNKELEKLAEKLDPPNKTFRKRKEPYNENAQEESSSRAKSNAQIVNDMNYLHQLKYKNANAVTHPRPENAEADTNLDPENTRTDTNLEPENAEANTQDSAANQSLDNSKDDQTVYKEISSDQEDDKMQSQGKANNAPLRNISHISDIVISNNVFPPETHDEDQIYKRLIAGFIKLDDLTLPISYNDPDLEAMIFPDLFPTKKGHYENVREQLGCTGTGHTGSI